MSKNDLFWKTMSTKDLNMKRTKIPLSTYFGVDHEPLLDFLADVDDWLGGRRVAQPHPDLVTLWANWNHSTIYLNKKLK